jgi:hypothetical protein
MRPFVSIPNSQMPKSVLSLGHNDGGSRKTAQHLLNEESATTTVADSDDGLLSEECDGVGGR